ncbi:MAG: hypothetical protein HPZ91_03820 [Lentisphaeria bacterium]|nr:hypothetical protein [Lentisphaeria bacterium]
MSQGYSMKHIGITIVVSLIVVVLISPLLRPKSAEAPVPAVAEVTPELRAAVTEYRDAMQQLWVNAALKYEAGALSINDAWSVKLDYSLAALDLFALDAPGRGNGAARAVVNAYFRSGIWRIVKESPAAVEDEVLVRVAREACLARIELARLEPEIARNPAFAAARAAWEKEAGAVASVSAPLPSVAWDRASGMESLKKMFEAEIR